MLASAEVKANFNVAMEVSTLESMTTISEPDSESGGVAAIDHPLSPCVGASAVLFSILEATDVGRAVGPYHFTMPVVRIVFPVTIGHILERAIC